MQRGWHLILGLLAVAAAAQDFACPTLATQEEVDAALATAVQAVEAADIKTLKEQLNIAGPKMPCLDNAADRRSLARYGQLMSIVSFMSQDEEAEIRWGLFARLIDPDVAWPPSIGAEHPLRQLLAEQQVPPAGGPEGMALAPPKGGAIAINGNWTTEATAFAEVPVLVQVFDSTAKPTTSYWQDGAAFPDWILGPPIPDWTPPKWVADPAAARAKGKGEKVARADRAKKDRDVEWQPILVTTGLVAGSGVLFGLAASTHGGLDDASTPDDLRQVRSTTNTFATLGGLAGLAAVSYAGISLFTDGDVVGLAVRW